MLTLNPVSLKGGPLAVAGSIKKASERVELLCSRVDETPRDEYQGDGDVWTSFQNKTVIYRQAFKSIPSHSIDHAPDGTQSGHRVFETFKHLKNGALEYSRYESVDGVPTCGATYEVDEENGSLETRIGNSISLSTFSREDSLPGLSENERAEIWNIAT